MLPDLCFEPIHIELMPQRVMVESPLRPHIAVIGQVPAAAITPERAEAPQARAEEARGVCATRADEWSAVGPQIRAAHEPMTSTETEGLSLRRKHGSFGG